MKQNLFIPGAIVLAGVLIAVSVVLRGDGTTTAAVGAHRAEASAMRMTENAHIRGSRDADVTIVEFSDFECPFCARLHPTLERIVEESNGTVAWEYRHFPLPNHRNAESAAASSECIAELAGNDAFWDYADNAFLNQRSLGTAYYESEATRLGANLDEFRSCVSDSETRGVVRNDYNQAVANGGRGTPFGVIVYADGTQRSFSGALPYEQLLPLVNQQ